MAAPAGTFVYVSNAADGDIGIYRMQPDGALQPGARAKAADVVGPMAMSPDRRFLYAAVRSKPFSVHAYAINPGTGALKTLSVSPLAESFPYISLDKTGRNSPATLRRSRMLSWRCWDFIFRCWPGGGSGGCLARGRDPRAPVLPAAFDRGLEPPRCPQRPYDVQG